MISLKERERSVEHVLSSNFISCPFSTYKLRNSLQYMCRKTCKVLFNYERLGCPCNLWGITYAREYYWQAMNPFFDGGY